MALSVTLPVVFTVHPTRLTSPIVPTTLLTSRRPVDLMRVHSAACRD
jgi:hypothetical protein